jgi:hypothetical protein
LGVSLARNNLLARFGLRLKAQLVAWATEETTPARVALGFATGIFIGIVPSFAVGSLIALYLAGRLGLHQGAALSGSFLMNPLTAPLFYSLSYAVGAVFSAAPAAAGSGLLASIQQIGWAFLLGNAIVALTSATLLGLAAFFWVRRSRARNTPPKPPLEFPALPA